MANEVDLQVLQPAFGHAGEAARESQGALEVFDVCAGPPGGGSGRGFRMPEVIRVRPPGDGRYFDAVGAEAHAQIVVFAAPAAKIFVVAVDAFIVGAGDAQVAAEELRATGMA